MMSLYIEYNSKKRSDVTGNRFEWELGENPLPQLGDNKGVKAIEFHRIMSFYHVYRSVE